MLYLLFEYGSLAGLLYFIERSCLIKFPTSNVEDLHEHARTEPGIAVATLDLTRIQRARASMGFFRDRRPELYRTLVE